MLTGYKKKKKKELKLSRFEQQPPLATLKLLLFFLGRVMMLQKRFSCKFFQLLSRFQNRNESLSANKCTEFQPIHFSKATWATCQMHYLQVHCGMSFWSEAATVPFLRSPQISHTKKTHKKTPRFAAQRKPLRRIRYFWLFCACMWHLN